MESVSCATTSFCIAVGYEVTTIAIARAWRWNGKSWTLMTGSAAPDPYSTLNAVSCPAVNSCFAVGKKVLNGRSSAPPFVEHWNGQTWQQMFAPAPDTLVWGLDDVWCGKFAPGQFHCVAVGHGESETSEVSHGFIDMFNGTTWSIPKFPDPWPTMSRIDSVSCSSFSFCVAVGEKDPFGANPPPFSLELSGGTWSVLNSSAIPGTLHLFGFVGCSISAGCYQAGNNYDNTQARVQMLRLVGTQWQAVQSAQPPLWTGTLPIHSYVPRAITCTTLHFCVTVGEHDSSAGGGTVLPLVLTKP
jgi:hypothetical protein